MTPERKGALSIVVDRPSGRLVPGHVPRFERARPSRPSLLRPGGGVVHSLSARLTWHESESEYDHARREPKTARSCIHGCARAWFLGSRLANRVQGRVRALFVLNDSVPEHEREIG